MSKAFDYEMFERRFVTIIVHSKGKPFAELAKEVETVRQEYEGVRSVSAKSYIRRNLDRWLLMFAIDTSQLHTVVDRLYKRNVRQGFNGLHAEVTSALEYADYCSGRGNDAQALRVLHKVAKQLTARRVRQNFRRPIETLVRRLEKKRRALRK
jgi:hypothetical protein